jgi:hypothetical protein
VNTYGYVLGNPVSYTDPLGLAPNNACVAAWTIGGAACGGSIGYGAGGIVGGVGGGAVCTMVAPGVGTVGCGVAGASGGSTAGGAFGGAVGGYIGNKLGNMVCSTDDKEARRQYCAQLYEAIIAECKAERNAHKRQACFAAAAITEARCLQGKD